MLIYEKNDKLNIKFNNGNADENFYEKVPDVEIARDGEKTSVLVNNAQVGGGQTGPKMTPAPLTI